MKMKNFFSKKKGGYTIIETMIAISLFLVVVMMGMDSLLNANVVHQKWQDMRSIIDNLNFIMEDMSRNIRTGYNYRCISGNDDLSDLVTTKSGQNCWGIAFESATGNPSDPDDQWLYVIDSTQRVLRVTQAPYTGSNLIPLTTEEIVMDSSVYPFSVLGAEPPSGNEQQPLVLIRLAGDITSRNNIVTPFFLQTTVSQRLIDIGP
jgi:hypothetical protein